MLRLRIRCPLALAALVTLAASAVACAGRAPDRAADLVVEGGRVSSLDPDAPAATAVSIRDGRIVSLSAMDAQVRVDASGGVIMPAFVDHHVHLLNVGLWLLNDRDEGRLFLDLSNVTSLDELTSLVRARAKSLPAGAWVTGAGWSQAGWGTEALPTSAVLDAAAPGHPVFLARGDGHAGWVNRAALLTARITSATPNPAGGLIMRDHAGLPAGMLLERANELVAPLLPRLSDDDVQTAFRLAAEALAARGVVEVDDAGVLAPPGVVALNEDFGRYVELLRRADAIEPLPVRVNLMVPAPSALADALLASAHDWQVSPQIRVTHLKLFADGALGSRGAALTHPYADDPSTSGVPRMTTADIVALARRALGAGLGVATHAIGDEAVKQTLDAFEPLLAERPALERGRLRIEHFSYAREEDFARAVRLGIVLSVQSNFNADRADLAPLGALRTGAANEPRVYAWRRLHDMGAVLVEGSDYFARPREPLAGYRDALTLRNALGDGGLDRSVRQAALAMQMVQLRPDGSRDAGIVRAGARADLIVVDADPLSAKADDLTRMRVLATIAGGRVTYRAAGTDRR